MVSMVQEVRYLLFQSLVMRKIGHVTVVMVGTDKNEMIGVREKLSNSRHFGAARILAGAK